MDWHSLTKSIVSLILYLYDFESLAVVVLVHKPTLVNGVH